MAEDIDQWWIKPPAKTPAPAPVIAPAPATSAAALRPAAPAPTSGFVTGGGTTRAPAPPAVKAAAPAPAPAGEWTGPVSTSASGSKPAVNTPLTQQNMSDPRVAAFWGDVKPQKPDGSNTLGGNMGMGVVNWLGFKTAQEYLDFQAENERKAALGDPNGFVAGPGNSRPVSAPAPPPPAAGGGTGTGSSSGGGAGTGGSTGGSSSGGIVGSQVNGGNFQPWNVTAPQTVQSQAAGIIAADSPLMQQARGRAMQQMNERGLINSSLGIQAAQDAVMERALQIAQPDAATNAQSAQFNANQGNAWNLAQQQMSQQDRQFAQEMEYKRWSLMQNFENQKQLNEIESKYSEQLNSDANFQKQYSMYLDALFQIDMNTALDPETKLAMKVQRGQELDDYVAINKLGINMDFSDYWAAKQAPAAAPSSSGTSSTTTNDNSMFRDRG